MPRDEVVDRDNFSMEGWVGASIIHAGCHDFTIGCAQDHRAERKEWIGAPRGDRQLHRPFMDAQRDRGKRERLG